METESFKASEKETSNHFGRINPGNGGRAHFNNAEMNEDIVWNFALKLYRKLTVDSTRNSLYSLPFVDDGDGDGNVLRQLKESYFSNILEKYVQAMGVVDQERRKSFFLECYLRDTMTASVYHVIKMKELKEDLEYEFFEILIALANLIEIKDPYTAGHSQRVMKTSLGIAKTLKVNELNDKDLAIAAILHDVGKIGVCGRVLNKPSGLTSVESREVEKHVLLGWSSLKNISRFRKAAKIIRHHHERYDGEGYPDGLEGDRIPIGSRIIAVADTFDALSSPRPYRQPLDRDDVYSIIREGRGKQFDPMVVDAF